VLDRVASRWEMFASFSPWKHVEELERCPQSTGRTSQALASLWSFPLPSLSSAKRFSVENALRWMPSERECWKRRYSGDWPQAPAGPFLRAGSSCRRPN
jgi:hypothetical protein